MESLPRNLDAERALLSAVVLDPRHFHRLGSRIVPELFDGELHRVLAAVMRRVHAAGLDVTMVTILDEIDRDDGTARRFRETDDGLNLLAELGIAGIPSNAAESYLKLAEERAAKRDILRAGEELAGMARNGASAADLARALHVYARRMEGIISAVEDVRTVDVLAALSASLPPVPWIADGWLGAGDVVIFGGEWASGKSLIALDLAISVALGIPWMGRIPIDKPGPVLYVDEENNARNVTRRLSRMLRGRNIDPGYADAIPLRYLSKNHLRLDAPAGRQTLERELAQHRPVLTVLDSLIRFHGADENSNTDVAALFGEAIVPLATKHGCAFLILDHMRKPSKEDERFDTGHRIRGAGDKAGVGDGIWTVEGDRETDARTLSCRKNRWEDSLPPSMTTRWIVSEDESAAWIECKDAKIAADNSIMAVLGGFAGGILAGDLYDHLASRGITKRTAQRMIRNLVHSGVIETRREPQRRVRYWVGTLVEGAIS
jgi:hypothetical protein